VVYYSREKLFFGSKNDIFTQFSEELLLDYDNELDALQFLKRVFSVDTLVKPLPPVMAYSVSRNINFFFRIFTQFWGKLYSIKIILC
jgi:hypothetical protein